jgi:hypothetical protein
VGLIWLARRPNPKISVVYESKVAAAGKDRIDHIIGPICDLPLPLFPCRKNRTQKTLALPKSKHFLWSN